MNKKYDNKNIIISSRAYFLQSALGALPKTSGSQGLKSLRNTQHIGKKDEEATKLRSRKHRQEMEPDRDPTIHQHA
jgi:hypothetical protein